MKKKSYLKLLLVLMLVINSTSLNAYSEVNEETSCPDGYQFKYHSKRGIICKSHSGLLKQTSKRTINPTIEKNESFQIAAAPTMNGITITKAYFKPELMTLKPLLALEGSGLKNLSELLFWTEKISLAGVPIVYSPDGTKADIFVNDAIGKYLGIGVSNLPIKVSSTPLITSNYATLKLRCSNYKNILDATKDGIVTPHDALRVINVLNTKPGELKFCKENNLIDVNLDGSVSPDDLDLIINHLNSTKGMSSAGSSSSSGIL